MSHISHLDAELAQARSTGHDDQNRCAGVRQILAIAHVPMLDWPSDLFSDNAGFAELITEDFAETWAVPAQRPEMLIAA